MPKLVPECLSLLYLGNIPLKLSDPALMSSIPYEEMFASIIVLW